MQEGAGSRPGLGSVFRNIGYFFSALLVLALTQTVLADPFKDATVGHSATTPLDGSYFGVHIHRLVPLPGERASPWPESAGFGVLRLWDSGTAWFDIQNAPGAWHFDRLDASVDAAQQHHAKVLLTLGGTPKWASARPDEPCPYGHACAAEPLHLEDWRAYVMALAQRYRHRISAYELWNEPNLRDLPRDRNQPGFYTGDVKSLVEMARIAREVLNAQVPGTALCTPGFVGGLDRLSLFLRSGGAPYVDAVCYHFYAHDDRHFVEQIAGVRAAMKAAGVGHLPIWNTETGVDAPAPGRMPSEFSAPSESAAAARLLQFEILGAAAGIAQFDFYAWDNGMTGVVDAEGREKPAAELMARAHRALRGSQLGPCRLVDDDIRLCEAHQGGELQWWLWRGQVAPRAQLLDSPPDRILGAVLSTQGAASYRMVDARHVSVVVGASPVRISWVSAGGVRP
ncbi:MAG: hypothetical protein JOY60_00030 [Burkholderiaceae bacterium]|nr:hypothetical protein [Roseateles sp.]MBV8468235.1 hypothetical protein [Burkholderiaceae bacterium]